MGLIKRRQSAEALEADVALTCPRCGVGSKRLGEYASLDMLTRSFIGGELIHCEHCGYRQLPEPREDDPEVRPEDPRFRIVLCPNCRAETRIKRRPKGERLDPMTAEFVGVGRRRCRSCKHKWTPEAEPG